LNNPNQFLIIRCGVLTGAYIIGYLILRITLETQRAVTELVIPGIPIADFIILGLIFLVGV
jgi:phosphatidylglycerol---prolipoprotein diacylglyceryl transferase